MALAVLTATAVFIELRAHAQGRWVYAAAMPTVETVGLSPLVQLPLTGAVAIGLAHAPAVRRRGPRGSALRLT